MRLPSGLCGPRPSQPCPGPSGLCGNFNGLEGDDFKTAGGLVEATGAGFANTWKVQASCQDKLDWLDDPCSLNIESGEARPLGPWPWGDGAPGGTWWVGEVWPAGRLLPSCCLAAGLQWPMVAAGRGTQQRACQSTGGGLDRTPSHPPGRLPRPGSWREARGTLLACPEGRGLVWSTEGGVCSSLGDGEAGPRDLLEGPSH